MCDLKALYAAESCINGFCHGGNNHGGCSNILGSCQESPRQNQPQEPGPAALPRDTKPERWVTARWQWKPSCGPRRFPGAQPRPAEEDTSLPQDPRAKLLLLLKLDIRHCDAYKKGFLDMIQPFRSCSVGKEMGPKQPVQWWRSLLVRGRGGCPAGPAGV